MANNPIILCILDGWGIAPIGPGNAIELAKPKTFEYLHKYFPSSQLLASGPAVGLPEGQEGNSETGHLNIGAGRIVFQDLSLINMAIADGSFFTNKALLDSLKHLSANDSRLHLLGMIGNSGVHSYNDHLYALLIFAKKHNLKNVYLHLITDGRDSSPNSGIQQIEQVEEKISQIGTGSIASILGRFYAMDRDQRLDRTQKSFDCLTKVGSTSQNAKSYLQNSYATGVYDEFIYPSSVGDNPEISRIKAGDTVIFFNFRTDRPRQLTELFLDSKIPNLRFVTMTKYKESFPNPVMFQTSQLKNTLGEIISKNNLSQLRSAESEKVAMVSYYFNGQIEEPFSSEDNLFIDSPKVRTYDLAPRMSTDILVTKFSEKFRQHQYSLGVINIACPDMVAHTGKIDATIEAVNASDFALNNLVLLAKDTGSYLIVTADHGNAEELIDKNGSVDTKHSTNPVPIIIYHPHQTNFSLSSGVLADIAPTILYLLNLKAPPEMNGKNLILEKMSF